MPDNRVSSAKCHICGQKIPFTYGNPQELIQHMLGCHDKEPKHHLNSFHKSCNKIANSPNQTTKCNTCGGKRQSAGSATLVNSPKKCTNHTAPLLGSKCDASCIKKSPPTKINSRKCLQKGDDFIDDSCLLNCPNKSSSRINLGEFTSPFKVKIRCMSRENKSKGTCSCKVSDKRCPSRLANNRETGKKSGPIDKCCICAENSKRSVSMQRNSKRSVSTERNSKRSISMERNPKSSFFMERNPKFSLTVPEHDKPRKKSLKEKNKRSSSSSSPECHSGKFKRDSSVEKNRNSLINRKLSTSRNDSLVEKRRKSSGTEKLNRLSYLPSPSDKNRNSITEKRRSTLLDKNRNSLIEKPRKSLTEKIRNSITDRRRSSSTEKMRNSITDKKRNSIIGQKRKSSLSINKNKDDSADKLRKCSMAGKNKRLSTSLPPVDNQKCKFNVTIKKNVLESPTACDKTMTCNKAVCFSNDSDGEKQSIIEYDKSDRCGKQTISPYSPCNLIKRKGTKEMYKTTLETWTAGCGHLNCPRCHRKVVPLIRKQKNKIAFSSVGASLLLTCWPFCFLLPMMHNCSVDLYCPCCKYKIGVYNSATGKTTSVCCKNPPDT